MTRAAKEASSKLQGRPCLFLLLALLLLSPSALAEGPRVLASTYRVDLGDLVPGEAREGTFTLSNPGYEPVRVRFATDGEGASATLPEHADVAPGASTEVRYHYATPLDAAPGHRGEAVRLLAAPTSTAQGVGSLDTATAILFTSRTRAVGVTAIEAPTLLLPGEAIAGRVILVNTDNVTALVGVRLRWTGNDSASDLDVDLPPREIAPGATVAFPYRIENATFAPGARRLDAAPILDALSTAHASSRALAQSILVGVRSATGSVSSIVDLRDGNATVDGEVVNTGTVPITFRPRVSVRGDQGAYEIELDPITLQPGERRAIHAILALPPGRFSAMILADDEKAIGLASIGEDAASFEMRPAERSIAWGPIVIAVAAIAILLALALLLPRVWRRARAALARRAARRAAIVPARNDDHDDVHAFLAQLASDEHHAARPAIPHDGSLAILVDLPSLGAVDAAAIVRAVASGRDVVSARVYASVTSDDEAARAHHDLEAGGFHARVRTQSDFRVEIALDALHEARQGRSVILATHDAAFAELARRLHAEGRRIEIAGIGWRIPVTLRDHAAAVHDLGHRGAASAERPTGGRKVDLR